MQGALGGYVNKVRSSAAFPMSGMMGPSSPNPSYVPYNSFLAFSQRATQVTQASTGGGGAGGGGGGRGPGGFDMGGFGRALGSVKLPGANMIRELGGEFGFATKQVLPIWASLQSISFSTRFTLVRLGLQ
jgi:hypothetical protein